MLSIILNASFIPFFFLPLENLFKFDNTTEFYQKIMTKINYINILIFYYKKFLYKIFTKIHFTSLYEILNI